LLLLLSSSAILQRGPLLPALDTAGLFSPLLLCASPAEAPPALCPLSSSATSPNHWPSSWCHSFFVGRREKTFK